jgi:PAS domain S-box-containing protein
VKETLDTTDMSVAAATRLSLHCRVAARLAGLLGLGVGLAVLLGGWACDIAGLKTVLPGFAPMAPNTAICLMLVGAALWLDREGQLGAAKRILISAAAGVAGLIAGLTLTEYVWGLNLHIDELLFRNPATFRSPPTRMAAVTAVCVLLLVGALILSRRRSGFATGQHLAIVAGVLCLFNAIGYLFGIKSFYQVAFRTGGTTMAIHTSLTLGWLCAGVLLARPGWGLMSTVLSPRPGGAISRRLLPAALLIPSIFGWLRWQGVQIGLYDIPFGLTLDAAITSIIFSTLILRSGKILNNLDTGRARAEGATRESQIALSTSEASFQELADSMPQIVWAATPDGNLDYYNRRWYDYTGMTFAQTRDWGWPAVLHPDDLQNCINLWTHSLATCEPLEVLYRFRRASDNAYRWHLGRARAIRNAQGAVVRWFGTCTDIEDFKRAETEIIMLNEGLEGRVRERTIELDCANRQLAAANEELKGAALRLEYSNRELQDFASVASHDLQEPLRKVQAFGDRLKSRCGTAIDEQGRDYLDRMLNATKRMQSLILDLLSFARVTSQAQPFLPVDLAQVAREVLADLEVRIAETSAVVEVGDLPSIDADAMQMRQLLQNLIGNALKFRQKGEPAAVRVYAENADFRTAVDGMFRFVVEDRGIGFDEKYLDRIFKVFQRLHGRAEYEGTGVGLAICRKIAQRHGGDITARSSVGQGARFLVALPFCHGAQNGVGVLACAPSDGEIS